MKVTVWAGYDDNNKLVVLSETDYKNKMEREKQVWIEDIAMMEEWLDGEFYASEVYDMSISEIITRWADECESRIQDCMENDDWKSFVINV